MIGQVTFCLSLYLVLVTSNPVQQGPVQCNYQYSYTDPNIIETTCQQPANQNSPTSQPIIVQNGIASRIASLEEINQLLINKIMSNQCLQKILDPNTKLISQNGKEIQRQPNAVTPSVVNNYFILPPEVFLPSNQIQEVEKPKRRKKINTRKTNQGQTKNKNDDNGGTNNEETVVITNKARASKGKKRERNRNEKSTKQIDETEDDKDRKIKKTKNRRQKDSGLESEKETSGVTNVPSSKNNGDEQEHSPNKNNGKRKGTKRKQKSKIANEDRVEVNSEEPGTDVVSQIENSDYETVPENKSQLKNIELPLDNLEVLKDLIENKQQARNSKNDKIVYDSMKHVKPIPADMFNNFPYMPYNNYFPPHFNYPFDFTQFYQPYYGQNNKRGKKRPNRRKHKEENSEDLPNVVEIKLKTKEQSVTTESPIEVEQSDEEMDGESNSGINLKTENIDEITNNPSELSLNISSNQESEEEYENIDISVTPEEKIEILPEHGNEIIEDLFEYITPPLEREDIVSAGNNDGIINDYYPIFNDDAYYTSVENYQLSDLDSRLFYATDLGEEDTFNRDRQKYDSHDYKLPNDIRDRINFRRKYFNKDKDNILNNVVKENYIEPESESVYIKGDVNSKNDGVHFQVPPILENPDFRSVRIDKDIVKTENYDSPYYVQDKTPHILSRLTNDADVTYENKNKDYVETVYAKTRVVKYGVPEKTDETSVEDESEFASDGHTTYVLAKSLGPVEDFYW